MRWASVRSVSSPVASRVTRRPCHAPARRSHGFSRTTATARPRSGSAPDAGQPTRSCRAIRPVAQRVGFRLLLRDPGRRGEPVGPVLGREPEDHRHSCRVLRRGEAVLPPGSMADRSIEWLHGVRAPGRTQALLLLPSRLGAVTLRTMSPRIGPTRTRASSTRAGTSSAKRRSLARRNSGWSLPTPLPTPRDSGISSVGRPCSAI